MVHPDLSEQYRNEANLRIRIETHQRYAIGPPLEPVIDKALNLKGDECLLDVGTGPGDFPIRLRQSGHRGRIVGVDNSPGMIAKARSANVDVEFLTADAQALPFPDDSFDIVTARHMLYHVPDISQALSAIRRVLRPDGRFLAITNSQDNMRDYWQAAREAADTLRGQISDEMVSGIPARISTPFNDQTGPPLVQRAFGNCEVTLHEAALKFDSSEHAIRYFDSSRTMKAVGAEDWNLARKAFAGIVAERLRRGPWVVPKTVALLLSVKNGLG